jgi:hypothetical protein
MTLEIDDVARIVLIGIGATATMDAWLLLMKRLKRPTPDLALVGRWVGHIARGRWRHDAIAKASPVRGERALGWAVHYATGVAFAGLLVALVGAAWARGPSLLPALGVGLATVALPLFVMQPAMGAGIASSRTPTPLKNGLRSLANHAVFGVGLYLAAAVTAASCP